MNASPRIGLFVCECGDKVAGSLDIPALVDRARELPGVEWAGQRSYWCLPGGIELMQSTIGEQRLDRVVVAGCSPRTHDPLFRRALSGMLNPVLINVTNLRDLCAAPHRDNSDGADSKGNDQIAMAVAEICGRRAGAPRTTLIKPHAVIIGGGIAGLTAAMAISEAGIPVTLVERDGELGGLALREISDGNAANRVGERIAALRSRGNVRVLTNTEVQAIAGTVGRYQLTLSNGEMVEAGAIIVAIGAKSNTIIPPPHEASSSSPNHDRYAYILCDMSPGAVEGCSRTCCPAALGHACEIKRLSSDHQVTIFFREIYTAGGAYDDLVSEAMQLGVGFVRYPPGRLPQCSDGEIVTHDALTDREFRGSYDQVISCSPMTPQDDAARLASMLRLPIDTRGFMPDARLRLRPEDRIDRGIYVCGAAHYPCDTERAIFQAYDAAARAVGQIQKKEAVNWAPVVAIDATRCNGCGDCVRVCPFAAVRLEARAEDAANGGHADAGSRRRGLDAVQLAVVDDLICTGCGNCVSACPVKAAQIPWGTDEQIEGQIYAALGKRTRPSAAELGFGVRMSDTREEFDSSAILLSKPRVLIFACEWSGFSAAEIAGARQLSYPACTRVIRINCTGRLQPGLLLKALEMGAAGVLVLGCSPRVCHYEQGNEHAALAFEQANALARLIGFDKRLAMKWVPADDGHKFVQVIEEFVEGLGVER